MRAVEAAESIDVVEALWRLDLYPAEGLPAVAEWALAEGFDGPSLRALAELRRPTRTSVGGLFEEALRELGRDPMSEERACQTAARGLAARILDGRLKPREGAEMLVRDVWDRCRLERLAVFVRLAEEHDRRPDLREVIEEGIVREARRLQQG